MVTRLLFCLFFLITYASPALSWSTFQGNEQRTGELNTPTIKKPKILWSKQLKALDTNIDLFQQPLVIENDVYLNDRLNIYKLELKTGKEIWKTPHSEQLISTTYQKNKVIVSSETKLFALDAKTGKQLWNRDLSSYRNNEGNFYLSTHLLVISQSVIIGTSSGYVLAVDTQTGKTQWEYKLQGTIRGGASSNGQTIFIGNEQGKMVALTTKGKLVWERNLSIPYPEWSGRTDRINLVIQAAPTLVNNKVIITFIRNGVFPTPAIMALDSKTGQTLWQASGAPFKTEWGNIRSSPAVKNNLLYYGEPYSNELVALDTNSGKPKWVSKAGYFTFEHFASPAIAGNSVILPRFDGGLYAVDSHSGQLKWKLYLGKHELIDKPYPENLILYHDDITWRPFIPNCQCTYSLYSSPAISPQGHILVTSGEGYLYCIGDESWVKK